jgi:adenylosuccinate synthase
VRVAELFRPGILAARVGAVHAETGALLAALGEKNVPPVDAVLAMLTAAAARVRPHVADTGRLLRDRLKAGATLLAEGAHGAMLDLSSGTYPFVTSSHCTSAASPPASRSARALDASL